MTFDGFKKFFKVPENQQEVVEIEKAKKVKLKAIDDNFKVFFNVPEDNTDRYVFGNNINAQNLVLRYHYSKRLPGSPVCVCTQYRNHVAVAAVFFSSPPTRWSEPVIELSRLVRKEDVEPKPILTKLISEGVKECKRLKFDLIVSFADATQGHHGGIYQACSWNYHEQRKSANDGWVIDGEFIPRRTCYAKWGTSGDKLKEILHDRDVVKHFDSGKHLYWKALNKKGRDKAKRLDLRSSPYCKESP